MLQTIEVSTIRILGLNNSSIGAGFMIADRHAVTCAHVVSDALAFLKLPETRPQGIIKIDFPLVSPGKIISAKVIAWQAFDDIAVLELTGDIPPEVLPAELLQGDDLWKHPFRTFGFPTGFDNGVWASGRILAREATGWLQIEDTKQTGYFVQPGFSGGQIWDEQLGGVIGMTVAADTRSGVRAAFVVPIKALVNLWPDLEKQVKRVPSLSDDAPAPGEAPFKGLQYFDVADSSIFFGRNGLTKMLLERIRTQRFLAVVGASGSGKSSIVRAGVVAALLDQPDWRIHIVTPTSQPLETLALALTSESESVSAAKTLREDMRRDPESLHLYARRLMSDDSKARMLLVVDQFEELFTLCHDSTQREAYINNLLVAVSEEKQGPMTVILTLRADFYHHCMQYQPLLITLPKHQINIGIMTSEELREAIVGPAKSGGWEFEPGLVDLMLRDASDEPGALPLLSHALLATWVRRRNRMLTLAGYSDAGGVHGAIAKSAEETYCNLTTDQKKIARKIFLRLTELGNGTQDTRRRVRLDELEQSSENGEPVDAVLKMLVDARLVITDKDSAEVAHEALIREWPTLRLWLDEDRDALCVHHHLTETAQNWERNQRDTSYLYRGTRLAQALDLAKTHATAMSPLEMEHLRASKAVQSRERLRLISLFGIMIFALVLGGLALNGQLKLKLAFIYHPLDMEWVEIPEGEFEMGNNTKGEESPEKSEAKKPAHIVYLDAYEIGKYEVTNEQYAQCVKARVCDWPPGYLDGYNSDLSNYPVANVNWESAKTFCEWNDSYGRLPTEAEWEKAARGIDNGKYPWDDVLLSCDYANYATGDKTCIGDRTPVGSYESGKSQYGAYDMIGNVFEWVQDWYAKEYYSTYSTDGWPKNPIGPDNGEYRVLRGGSWSYVYATVPSSVLRFYELSTSTGPKNNIIGFRCARDASP